VSGSSPPDGADRRLELEVAPSFAGLAAAQESLNRFLEDRGDVGARGAYFAELAFEELVTNILRHGRRRADEPPIAASVRLSGGLITLTVEDDGPPFDPLAVPEPEHPASLEDAKVGGLGLVLIRRSCERMHYERTGNRNRVTVTLRRHPA
jgi:serine/threonine-protein kinase RsbW